MADKDKKVEEDQAKKIRMTLTSRNVESLERTTSELLQKAREQATVQFKGPVRLPTKHLRMTIRKSPCGEGSKTWDRFEMRIHKRVIDFACSLQQLKDITSIQISQGVEVELNFDQE